MGLSGLFPHLRPRMKVILQSPDFHASHALALGLQWVFSFSRGHHPLHVVPRDPGELKFCSLQTAPGAKNLAVSTENQG